MVEPGRLVRTVAREASPPRDGLAARVHERLVQDLDVRALDALAPDERRAHVETAVGRMLAELEPAIAGLQRQEVVTEVVDEVLETAGPNPLLDIAQELERIALEDDYFVTRRLYPNVDFYSGLIYQAMGFPVEMFPVLFAIPRTAGWISQWEEMLRDSEQKIARPRQIYKGSGPRDYVPALDPEYIWESPSPRY